MVRDRNRRAVIAAAATVLWLAYMMIGLPVLNACSRPSTARVRKVPPPSSAS